MSTTVRKSGITGNINRYNTRGIFTLSDGSVVAVIHDLNSASSFDVTYGDRTGTEKIYVYSSTDREVWTLRATLTNPLAGAVRVTANLAPNDTIGIALWTATAIRYATVSPTWVASSWELPRAALTAPIAENNVDLSFTSGNVPIISALRSNTSGSTRLQLMAYVRRTSDSTWIATTAVSALETSTTPKSVYQEVSVAALTGGTAAVRPVVMAAAHGAGTTDRGVKLYTMSVDETTGAVSSITLRGSALAVGDVPGSSNAVSARNIVLFQSDDNEYTLGIQHLEGSKRFGLVQGTLVGTTWTQTQAYVSSTTTHNMVQYNMSMSYTSGLLTFHYANRDGHLLSYLAKYDGTASTWRFGAGRYFDNRSRVTTYGLQSNGGPHVQYSTNDILFYQKIANNRHEVAHHWSKPLRAPLGLVPGNGAISTSSTPVVRAQADLDLQYPQSLVKMRWEFALDALFTTNLVIYQQSEDKFKLVENTHLDGASVPFADVLPAGNELSQDLWYVRAAHVDEYGVVGAFTTYNAFTITHPPVAAGLVPNGSNLLYAATVPLRWEFSDPSPTDYQTAFRVIVTRTDTNAVIHDSGKLVSTDKTYNAPVPTSVKDIQLAWVVILWDKDDVEGPSSTSGLFQVVDKPAQVIDSPTPAQVLTTAIPHILFTPTVGGIRRIKKYQVKITGTSAYTSPWIAVDLASGTQIDFQPPPELLLNTGTYNIAVQVEDSLAIRSTVTSVNVTTAWVPPATSSSLAVSVTPYNTEGQGWIAVTWADTNRDVDFTAWRVYRRSNLLDPLTQAILETGDWLALSDVTDTAASYTFKDYTAPSGHQVQYRVEQQVIRFGDVVESINSTVISSLPVADSYWLIEPDAANAFRLGTVTSDQYTEEFEESDYVVIGLGSRYEQGERKGYRGTLSAQIRNNFGISARQNKRRLEEIKQGNRRLYLRTPFGDLFRVAVGGMSIDRVAGVGLSEFVNVTIPYFEVSE